MIGAIVGDIIGSYHEFRDEKIYDGEFFLPESTITDDSVLSIATADSILKSRFYSGGYQLFCRNYRNYGYGPSFLSWADTSENYLKESYSYGNGSAMRVSPIGWAFNSAMRVMTEAQQSASITHCHPEGIKGAQATAVAIFMARMGSKKEEILSVMDIIFEYDCYLDLDELHETYTFDVSCQGTVPVAIACAMQADSFEKVMRNGLYVGGDTDTLLAIAGSIAEPMYGVPKYMRDKAESILDSNSPIMLGTLHEFERRYGCGKSVMPTEGNSEKRFIMDFFKSISKIAKLSSKDR